MTPHALLRLLTDLLTLAVLDDIERRYQEARP